MAAGTVGRPSDYRDGVRFTLYTEREVYNRFKSISQREGKSMSRLLQEYMKRYVNEHDSGNEQYKLTNWYHEDFKATPAFLETQDKWNKYMDECDSKELSRIMGQAQAIQKKAQIQFYEQCKKEMFKR